MFDHNEVQEMFLTALSKKQCETIHAAALQILEQTGVIFQSEEARSLLKKGGAKVDGEKVFLHADLVEWALEIVPSSFTLYDQEGNPRHEVGGRHCLFGTGSDCLNILDHRTGQRRAPLLSDLVELVTICDFLPNIDFVMSMVIPSDSSQAVADRIQMETMLKYSIKPIINVSFSAEGTRDILEMAEIVAEGAENLRKHPFIIHYIQPVRALWHNEDAVNKLLLTVKRGLPCLYQVSAIMGLSGPITAAGYQAMGAAGQLAALVLAQLIREGTPFVVRGGRIVEADMKSMLSTFANPGNRVFSSEMAHFYNLPCFGNGGASDSKTVDWQTVAEATLTLMADALIGANLIHDVGYIDSGVTYSAEMLVLCNEIISWIKTFKKGAPVNEETLALDLIHDLGFHGDFFTTDHTFRHFREQWESDLFDRNTYETWEEKGSQDIKKKIHNRISEILVNHKCRILPPNIQKKLQAISEGAKKTGNI